MRHHNIQGASKDDPTSTLDYFPLGQYNPRHHFSSAIPYTSIGQSLSPVAIPFAWTTPTSLPNTGPQSVHLATNDNWFYLPKRPKHATKRLFQVAYHAPPCYSKFR